MTEARPGSRVVLSVDGTDWAGWTELEIARSVERVAGGFVLGLTERWSGQDKPRPIRPGLACTVAIDGEVLITGWIDDVEHRYDHQARVLAVRGRDRTGDLFDCAAVHRPFEILGLKLDAIATRLCQPFNIPVTAQVDVGRPFARFAIQPGESVWEAIERGCRQRAILPMPDGKGGLLLTRAEWQRAVAAGKAVRGTYTVQDWRADGALWQPNTLVRVTDSLLRLDDAEMLIAATRMRLTETGTLTEVEVAPRDAYRLIPEGADAEGGSASSLDPFRIFATGRQ